MRVLPLAVLVACAPQTDFVHVVYSTETLHMDNAGKDGDDDDDYVEACQSTIDDPFVGDRGKADPDTDFVALLDFAIGPDEDWEIEVMEADGGSLPGISNLSYDGLEITFIPGALLDWETTYDVILRVCGAQVTTEVTTRKEPVDSAILEGRTFALDWSNATIVDPPDLDSEMTSDFLLVQIVAATEDELYTVATPGTTLVDVEPDCASVVEPPPADFSDNPLFEMGPTDMALPADGGVLEMQDLTFTGEFDPSGDTLEDVRIVAELPESQFGVGCALMALLTNGSCSPCPSTAEDCLRFEVQAPAASWMPLVDVEGFCGL